MISLGVLIVSVCQIPSQCDSELSPSHRCAVCCSLSYQKFIDVLSIVCINCLYAVFEMMTLGTNDRLT